MESKSYGMNCFKLEFFCISPRISSLGYVWELFCKFQKFANFANLISFVFLHESAHLATFEFILKNAKIFKFCKLDFFLFLHELVHLVKFETTLQNSKIRTFWKFGFFCISPRIGTFGKVWDFFFKFKNSHILQTWIFLYFSTNWHI